ncbi:MAG: hypothetical protein MUC88_10905, partial [Planctomycetes bacterium]|nr:hypothetical protein [Planctomycetota bacterium]
MQFYVMASLISALIVTAAIALALLLPRGRSGDKSNVPKVVSERVSAPRLARLPKSGISYVGMWLLGLFVTCALLALPVLFIAGGVVIAPRILPWLMLLSILTLAFNIGILLPLALIPPTRPWAGLGFYISSYVFGLTGWSMGLLLTWMLWGGAAVVIGLLMLGIGVVPIAMLATLCNGMWTELGLLLLFVVLTFGLRALGLALTVDVAPADESPDESSVFAKRTWLAGALCLFFGPLGMFYFGRTPGVASLLLFVSVSSVFYLWANAETMPTPPWVLPSVILVWGYVGWRHARGWNAELQDGRANYFRSFKSGILSTLYVIWLNILISL